MQIQTLMINCYSLFDRSEVKVKDGVKFKEVGDLQLGTGVVVIFPVSKVYHIAKAGSAI